MTHQFQLELLSHLFQTKEAIVYKDILDQSFFDITTCQLVYSLWHDYVSKYHRIPSKHGFIQFADQEIKRVKTAVKKEKYDDILNTIALAYSPTQGDFEFTRDVIIEYAVRKGARNLVISIADKLRNATVSEVREMSNEFNRIVSIGSLELMRDKNRGGLLFRDGITRDSNATIMGHPTYLQSLNRMTAAGGFYTPQHILFVGGPKAFKTGTLITLAVEYARSGLNVFFADAENSINSIKTRIKQCLLECERHEVEGLTRELTDMLRRLKRFGGDIASHHFPSGSTLDAVDIELDRLATEEDWHPHVIFYDPIYKFASTNRYIKDENLRLQNLNAHAGKINDKHNTFSFTAAKIKAAATHKLVIKQDDLALDFAGNYDAHAVFAICRTEDEEQSGYARIVAVSQREGAGYRSGPEGTCAIKIDAATNTITELDSQAYLMTLEEEHQSKGKSGPKRKYIPPSTLKDE